MDLKAEAEAAHRQLRALGLEGSICTDVTFWLDQDGRTREVYRLSIIAPMLASGQYVKSRRYPGECVGFNGKSILDCMEQAVRWANTELPNDEADVYANMEKDCQRIAEESTKHIVTEFLRESDVHSRPGRGVQGIIDDVRALDLHPGAPTLLDRMVIDVGQAREARRAAMSGVTDCMIGIPPLDLTLDDLEQEEDRILQEPITSSEIVARLNAITPEEQDEIDRRWDAELDERGLARERDE